MDRNLTLPQFDNEATDPNLEDCAGLCGARDNCDANDCQPITERTSFLSLLTPVNPDTIPNELRNRNQWVCWRYAERPGESKPTKIPVNVRTGENASTTRPDTWATFVETLSAYEHRFVGVVQVDGIGFVFHNDHIGIDLDNACDPDTGKFKPWALELLTRLQTYTELSPSRTGAHLISRGSLPESFRGTNRPYEDGKVEIYSRGRFFTVTGRRIVGTPDQPQDCQKAVLQLYKEISPAAVVKPDPLKRPIGRTTPYVVTESDLINKAQNARNGAKFGQLWDGDTSEYGNDDSAADMALCCHLAYWTGGNAAEIDSLFRQSGLMREKWNRDDYRDRTIAAAISRTTESYGSSSTHQQNVGEIRRIPVEAGTDAPQIPAISYQLDRNRKGELRPNLNNVLTILECDHQFNGLVWFDEFLQKFMTGDPPQEWKDVDDINLTVEIQRNFGIPNISCEIVAKGVLAVGHRQRRNSVKEWLDSLVWDGIPRIDGFFPDFFGAISTPYTIGVGRNFWISMAARISYGAETRMMMTEA